MTREEWIKECEMILRSAPYSWSKIEAKKYTITMANQYYNDDPLCDPEDAINVDRQYWEY